MPALVTCGKKWTVGGDDFVLPSLLAVLARLIGLGFMVGVLVYLLIGPADCENYPDDRVHPFLYGSLIAFVLLEFIVIINETLIFSRSVRGTIMNSAKRSGLAPLVIIRIFTYIVEFGLLVTCLAAVFGPAAKSLECPEYHDGPLVFAQVVLVLMITLLLLYAIGFAIYLDPLGVCCAPHRLKDMAHLSELGSEGVDMIDSDTRKYMKRKKIGKLHRNHIGAGKIVRKMRSIFCCIRPSRHRSRTTALQQMANALYTVFSNDSSLVVSDLIAGLILVSRDQKKKGEGCPTCRSCDEYCSCLSEDFRKFTFEHMPADDVPDEYQRQPPRQFDFGKPDDRLMFEDLVHYMKYAMSIYGWQLHVFNNLCCGLCQLSYFTCCALNYSCLNPRHGTDKDFVHDDCCTCGIGTIKARTKLNENLIRYASYNNEVYMAPYCICFDHGRKSIVLTVRGTLSIKDVLTDLSVSMVELKKKEKVPGLRGKQFVHNGMYSTAKEILKDLKRTGILEELLSPTSEYWNYRLVICGHSLGAGAASVLALLLYPTYPDLVCFAFSTPGCVFSFPLALHSRKFTTSVVLGNDIIPRITFRSLLFMKRQVRFMLKECKKPKAQVIFQPRWVERRIPTRVRVFCCGPHEDPDFHMEVIKNEITPKYKSGKQIHRITSLVDFVQKLSGAKKFAQRWRNKAKDKNAIHHFVQQIENGERIAAFPPGNAVHVQIKKKTHNWFFSFCIPNNLLVHYVSAEDFCVMKMDRGMVDDHLPNAVMSTLNQCQKQFIIDQGYKPQNQTSATWSMRKQEMEQLSQKRRSIVEAVEQQPVHADTDPFSGSLWPEPSNVTTVEIGDIDLEDQREQLRERVVVHGELVTSV